MLILLFISKFSCLLHNFFAFHLPAAEKKLKKKVKKKNKERKKERASKKATKTKYAKLIEEGKDEEDEKSMWSMHQGFNII